jgi:hypothetical protein
MEIRPPSKATPIVYLAGIPKIDAGQGDASGDASLCASSLSGGHMTGVLHIVCPAARTTTRRQQMRVLPSAALRRAAGCIEQRRALRQACKA